MVEPLKLLIIDDEQEILDIFTHLLPSTWKIDTFTNPRLAAAQYSSSVAYDLVITDLNMPQKSGEALIFDVKYVNPCQKIAVITANAENLNLPGDFGVRVFLKPFGYKVLIDELLKLKLKKDEGFRTPFSGIL